MFLEYWKKYFIVRNLNTKGINSNESAPCTRKETDEWPGIQNCCYLFRSMFDRKYTRKIMGLMKYSLDISNPQMLQNRNKGREFVASNDGYSTSDANNQNEITKLISRTKEINFAQGWR
jgi:hypothetical protein